MILTLQAKKKLEDELNYLENNKRKEIVKKIERAREQGDLSENAEYDDAKNEQGLIEARISEIKKILKEAIIKSNYSDDKVDLDSNIIVEDDKGEKREFTIVSFNEVDALNGKISNESPLGKAFLGKKKGDIVLVEVPAGKIKYKILDIKQR